MNTEQENTVTTKPEITFFKIINCFVLLFYYFQVMWFYSSLPIILKIVGAVTMFSGFISLFMPNEPSNVVKVKLLSFALYSGVLIFIIF